MEAWLTVQSGLEEPSEYRIDDNGYITIGRASHSTIFLHDHTVAKTHARLWLCNHGRLRCYGIKNGYTTLLNGNAVTVPFDMYDGDVMQIGDFEIRFTADDTVFG